MQNGDMREEGHATESGPVFKVVIGLTALFIAGCSAFFSVRGLGLLFVGSSIAVMIMAASLELGKLVAASFLYRYWHKISLPLRIYLTLAVLVLVGITSLGNYGFLARAYERTHTRVAMFESQISGLETEVNDMQHQIDSSRGQAGKANDYSREDSRKLQGRISESIAGLEQSLVRLQERRKIAQARCDQDLQVPMQRQAEQVELSKKAIASAEAAINELDERMAGLDRAVDTYTSLGGPGFLKNDGVKRGQELLDKQRAERKSIATQLVDLRKQQEQLRAEHGKSIESSSQEVAQIRERFAQDMARLDTEEQELRKSSDAVVAQAHQQLVTIQSQGKVVAASGDSQVEKLYQGIRDRNDEIRRIREQVAATDIGSYRFVARAFSASTDGVVKWLTLVLVLVFDPLAVSLAVGFSVVMAGDRRRRPSSGAISNMPCTSESALPLAEPELPGRSRRAIVITSILMTLLVVLAIAAVVYALRRQSLSAHASLVPADSFAVLSLRPSGVMRTAQSQPFPSWLGDVAGKTMADSLNSLLTGGFDPRADVYAFAKFPAGRDGNATQVGGQPVMLCGLVARIANPAEAEATLSRLAGQIGRHLQSSPESAAQVRSFTMIRHGQGRYMDPEGGFFTYALTDNAAIMLLEFEGDPKAPCVEKEIRTCLSEPDENTMLSMDPGNSLPERALSRDGAIRLWFDAARFAGNIPKNPAAQARYRQLQAYLGFDLVLNVTPANGSQVRVTADYSYLADRFTDSQQPTLPQLLGKLGPVEPSGITGRLMDRCADTLDYDSFIERFRNTLNSAGQDVVVEKSYASARDAKFTLIARFDQQSGSSLLAALSTIYK